MNAESIAGFLVGYCIVAPALYYVAVWFWERSP